MNMTLSLRLAAISFTLAILGACTVDKLEARLQADPQCKSVMNAKTGALMPCPGTDKEFYKSLPALSAASPRVTQAAEPQASVVTATSRPKAASALVECKPQLHQKSGSLMPCPAP
ncbi:MULTISPECIES: hypothetical protein [unclassified Polynucleobacter]|jgi:hypothetical protein|uniref:hypothetical protein n=1 Tax=unclassified Polynucleobacter TaxID=2640945 RepID=UPI000BCF9403|nr:MULTISPECIES: hypothetical protein [unclassified Polynucleobacter]OYY21298.1 MAG: hypothetical protein B7Y67_02400 [Polynucleobacter sp. 35-46-11]OZA77789.1 MAG: hypothetical protein B7X71_03690 [Polynucleobacter sp. 39-46-10]